METLSPVEVLVMNSFEPQRKLPLVGKNLFRYKPKRGDEYLQCHILLGNAESGGNPWSFYEEAAQIKIDEILYHIYFAAAQQGKVVLCGNPFPTKVILETNNEKYACISNYMF